MAVAASAALVAGSTQDARAQSKVEGFALNQFEPAPAGDAFFGVPSAGVGGHLVPRAMVMFDYAHRPLRFSTATGETPIVASQGFLRVDALGWGRSSPRRSSAGEKLPGLRAVW